MPIKNQSSWDGAFERTSEKYGKILDILYAARLKRLGIFKRVKSDSRILDIGCGNGPVIKLMKQHGYRNVYGIDINNYDKVVDFPFSMGSITNIPFADNSFDVLLVINTIHHLTSKTEYDMALSEMNRCLKPGGFIFVIDPANTLFRRLFYTVSCMLPLTVLKDWKSRADSERDELLLFWRINPLGNTPYFETLRLFHKWKSMYVIFRKKEANVE